VGGAKETGEKKKSNRVVCGVGCEKMWWVGEGMGTRRGGVLGNNWGKEEGRGGKTTSTKTEEGRK